MRAVEAFFGFVPLLVLGGLAVGVLKLGRRSRAHGPTDAGQLTRQAIVYGALLLTMVLAASGAVWAYGELTTSVVWRNNGDLAGALALVALGFPSFTALLVTADRKLRRDDAERSSFAWNAYLTAASMGALLGTMIGGVRVLMSFVDPMDTIGGRDVMMLAVWGLFFATHWGFLRLRHGVETDAHLAIGSVMGFAALFIGQAGLVAVLADRVYDVVFDRGAGELREVSAPWAALFVVGASVWLGIWLRQYEGAPRSELWYVTVLPIGTLVGYVTMLGATARTVYLGVTYVIGDTSDPVAEVHFDELPTVLAIGTTGAISWLYHRWFVAGEAVRSEAIRSYDYLLMGASLITAVVGAVIMVSAIFADPFSRDPLLAGVTVLMVGGLTWLERTFHVVHHQRGAGRAQEIASWVRRNYLVGIIGLGGLVALFAGIGALEGLFEDTLEGRLGLDSLVDEREVLAIVVVVGLVLWLHAKILRHDIDARAAVTPPPPKADWPSRIIVLGDSHVLPIDLREHADTSVEYWHRTDGTARLASLVDMDRLNDALVDQTGDDVLVLLNGDSTTVIPFER